MNLWTAPQPSLVRPHTASDVSISLRTVWSLTLLSPEQPHRTPLHTPACYFPEGRCRRSCAPGSGAPRLPPSSWDEVATFNISETQPRTVVEPLCRAAGENHVRERGAPGQAIQLHCPEGEPQDRQRIFSWWASGEVETTKQESSIPACELNSDCREPGKGKPSLGRQKLDLETSWERTKGQGDPVCRQHRA